MTGQFPPNRADELLLRTLERIDKNLAQVCWLLLIIALGIATLTAVVIAK